MQGFRITKTAKAFLRVFIIRNSFERRECFASPYANVSYRLIRMSRIALYECLACLDARVSYRSVRMSRMPRCECLACLDAKVSHRLMRIVRMPRCEGLALLGARVSNRAMRDSRNPRFFLSFYFAPYIEKSHFFCYPSEHSTNK